MVCAGLPASSLHARALCIRTCAVRGRRPILPSRSALRNSLRAPLYTPVTTLFRIRTFCLHAKNCKKRTQCHTSNTIKTTRRCSPWSRTSSTRRSAAAPSRSASPPRASGPWPPRPSCARQSLLKDWKFRESDHHRKKCRLRYFRRCFVCSADAICLSIAEAVPRVAFSSLQFAHSCGHEYGRRGDECLNGRRPRLHGLASPRCYLSAVKLIFGRLLSSVPQFTAHGSFSIFSHLST